MGSFISKSKPLPESPKLIKEYLDKRVAKAPVIVHAPIPIINRESTAEAEEVKK
jgi:hypothetical protein